MYARFVAAGEHCASGRAVRQDVLAAQTRHCASRPWSPSLHADIYEDGFRLQQFVVFLERPS